MSEIHIPQPDVLIHTARCQNCIVTRQRVGQDGQFVAVELEEVLVSVRVVNVDLRILKVDYVFLHVVLIAGFYDFVLELATVDVLHLNILILVVPDLVGPHFVLPPQQAFVLLSPTAHPLLLQSIGLFIFGQIPNADCCGFHNQ